MPSETTATRRRLLGSAGTAGVGALTAGCSEGEEGPTTAVGSPDGTTAVATGEENTPAPTHQRGRVPETADQAGIEALDEPGATIVLAENTTYTITDTPLVIESDDVSIIGSRSSVLRLADNTVTEDVYGAVMEIRGANVLLDGWTLDGNVQNQGVLDRYSLKFAPTAVNATVTNLHNYNALGDAFGKIRRGAKISNCFARDFTADGIDFRAQGEAVIANSVFVGKNPFKSGPPDNSDREAMDGNYWSGARVSNCVFVGRSAHGSAESHGMVVLGADDETGFRDYRFEHCLFRAADGDGLNDDRHGVNIRDNGGTTVSGFQFSNCTFEGGRGLFVDGTVTLEDSAVHGGTVRATGHGIRLGNATRTAIRGPAFVGPEEGNDIHITERASDTIVAAHPRSMTDRGTRTVVNGWGTNAGDPTSTGAWNGNGHHGVSVYDTDGGDRYTYLDGAWR
jgi:hypothetical protein